MSHIVSIQTKVRDTTAIAAACQRLHLTAPVHGTAELFGGTATGLLVQLPEWQYPAVIDTATGEVKYDNYGGRWGDPVHFDRFLQMYAVERAKLEARKQGYAVSEQTLQDGAIKVQIVDTR